MGSQGFNSPSATAEVSHASGISSWSNTNNALSSNNSYATVSIDAGGNTHSHWLKTTGYNFSIPSTATILGIQVEFEMSSTPNADFVIQYWMQLVDSSGTITGTEKTSGAGASIGATDGFYTWGSTSDMWGTSFNAGTINSSNFGVVFRVSAALGSYTIQMDCIRVKVTYSDYGHASTSISYPNGLTKTGPNNTPMTLTFTGGGDVTRYDLRTASGGVGTLIQSGSATSGSNSKAIAYNAPGLVEANNQNIYLRTGDATNWSSESVVQYSRDDTAPNSVVPYPFVSPSPVPTSKQYTLSIRMADNGSSLEGGVLSYQYRTASGTGGTLLHSGTCAHNIAKTTPTITDSALVHGNNTRWLRVVDPAGNIYNASFIVEANILSRNLSGSTGNLSGDLARRINKPVSGNITSITGSVFKLITKSYSGTMGTLLGAVSITIVRIVNVSGTIGNLSGTISRRINKLLEGTASPTGIVTRAGIPIRLAGSITGTGTIAASRLLFKTITGALPAMSGTVSRVHNRFRHAFMGAGRVIINRMKGGSDS